MYVMPPASEVAMKATLCTSPNMAVADSALVQAGWLKPTRWKPFGDGCPTSFMKSAEGDGPH